MEKEIVANTSSLIFLAKLDLFHLTKNIFSKVLLPNQVLEEIREKESPENNIIKKELNEFLIPTNLRTLQKFPLDKGEQAAISLCLEKNIQTFLSDDKKARTFARSLKIETIGILGILLWNLKRKKISKKDFIEILNKLIEKGYYLSPVIYSQIMNLVNK